MIDMIDTQAFTMLLALGTLWGAHFSLVKAATFDQLPAAWLATGLCLANAVLLQLIARIRQKTPGTGAAHWAFFSACALTGYVLPLLCELFSVGTLGAGQLSLLVASTPLITVLLGWLTGHTPPGRRRLLGVALGFASLMLLLWPALRGAAPHTMAPWLTAGLVPLCYASYHLIVERFWPAQHDAWQVAGGEALACLVWLLPLLLWQQANVPAHWPGLAALTPLAALSLCSVLEIWLYFAIVRRAGAVYVSQAGFLTVITGIAWGMLLFGERHDGRVWLAAAGLAVALGVSSIATPNKSDTQQS